MAATGGRGAVPVGISGGPTFGIRYETMLSGAVSFTAGAAYGQTTRRIVDPYVAKAVRTSKLIDCDVVLADLALQLSLSGAKSWHGFSPYVNGGMGIAVGSELAADSSQYTFGTKFAPEVGAGFRFYPIGIRRLSFQADIRAVYWRLQYPLSFKLASPADGTVVLPVTAPDAQWTRHSWISIGVGWNF